jgi:hypothetical protein
LNPHSVWRAVKLYLGRMKVLRSRLSARKNSAGVECVSELVDVVETFSNLEVRFVGLCKRGSVRVSFVLS